MRNADGEKPDRPKDQGQASILDPPEPPPAQKDVRSVCVCIVFLVCVRVCVCVCERAERTVDVCVC